MDPLNIAPAFRMHPLGYNIPKSDELLRIRVLRHIPVDFMQPVASSCTYHGQPPSSIAFSTDGKGISLFYILGYSFDPQYLQYLGVPYYSSTDIVTDIWLHISWPGYRKYSHTTCIGHDGTCGSIAFGVAEAYMRFLRDAQNWRFQPDDGEDPQWQITASPYLPFNMFSLRLLSLEWISGSTFQAEVDFVVQLI